MVQIGEGVEDIATIPAIPNQRAYNLPQNYIRIKLVTFNGLKLTYRQIITQDFFSTGTTTYPDRFSIWNNQLLLGPLPPANTFPIVIYYYREPNPMVNPTDIPEIPNRFRPYIADYGGAQQMIADGALQDAQVLMSRFTQGVQEYMEWQRQRTREFKTILDEAGYF